MQDSIGLVCFEQLKDEIPVREVAFDETQVFD
jgi:hypothetical protein